MGLFSTSYSRNLVQCISSYSGENVLKYGKFPDRISLLNSLKSCGKTKDIVKGSEIHANLHETGVLQKDIYLSATLISMYAKCGEMREAQLLFDELQVRNVVCWNTLISGYVCHGSNDEALRCFTTMQDEGLSPNEVTFICILKACGAAGSFEIGEQIHAKINDLGLLHENLLLGNSLVHMYVKCGMLERAQEVFDELPVRNVIIWTALIDGYVQHGLHNEAVNCFTEMQDEGISPDGFTYACILKSCGNLGSPGIGQQIHIKIREKGLMKKDLVLGTALIDMYSRCGLLSKAEEVFSEIPMRDGVAWNALISGYAQNGFDNEALNCVTKMQHEGLSPNAATFICIFKACGRIGDVAKAEEAHAMLTMHGLLKRNIVLGNALVDMYVKCGYLKKAYKVLCELPTRDRISWNTLIVGYSQHGLYNDVLKCFDEMQDEHVSADAITYACIMKACAKLELIGKGDEIHAEVHKKGLLNNDILLGTAAIDMYARCGFLNEAQKVFDKLPLRDAISWTALIAGYTKHGASEEAFRCFRGMQDEGLTPDSATFVCMLKACGSVGSTKMGEEIHVEMNKNGVFVTDNVIGTAIVDMYVNCGLLLKAQEVFHTLSLHNTISWNALMAGYAQFGQVQQVCISFSKMISAGVVPDVVTFIALLSACSQAGLLKAGQVCIERMSNMYCPHPSLEHYTCMVDMFGRAGCFDKAIMMFEKVPQSESFHLWSALLGACREPTHFKLGRWAFEHVLQMDDCYDAAYVCISNLYAAATLHEEVAHSRT